MGFALRSMLFYSFFKTLVGKEIVVELKNDLAIRGTLHSVDQYLNIKLLGVCVEDTSSFPHLQSVKNCFIRGSVIKYVQLPRRKWTLPCCKTLRVVRRRSKTPQHDGGERGHGTSEQRAPCMRRISACLGPRAVCSTAVRTRTVFYYAGDARRSIV